MNKISVLIALIFGLTAACYAKSPRPTQANVAYDEHERTVLDFWQAEGEGPRPLLVYIHGGGWMKGDKRAMRNADVYLEKGISVAAINYRLVPEHPLPTPVHDAARAVQFLRFKAKEWNIDSNKVVLAGGSAGACSSLWIACHDDLADPHSNDPVERESTRVQGAGVVSAQTSIDPKVIEPWIGPNVFLSMIYKAVGEDSLETMQANYAQHEAVYEAFSPINHLSQDDPALFLEYPDRPEFMVLPATSFNYGIHHGLFGMKFKEQSAAVGHNKVDLYIKDHDESSNYRKADDFLMQLLLGEQTQAESDAAPLKVACVGDSITFGHGIKDRSTNSYPAQLGDLLGDGYEVKNFGVSASTMLKQGNKPYWKQRQFQAAQNFEPNIIVIKLGTNDMKASNWKFKAEYKSDYLEMIRTFQALPSKPTVMICYPAPVFRSKGEFKDSIVREALIPLVDEVSHDAGVKVIDLYQPLAEKPELSRDGVHPNVAGATVMAETVAAAIAGKPSVESPWDGEKSSFHGFDQYDFKFEGNACKVVVPKTVADGKPWVWRARFWGHEPQFDIAMLERGYHVVYCHVGNLFGNATAVKRWDAFYDYLRFEHLFADRVVLEGMSRGGLIIYNWAAANPKKVAAIYADAPVMDFKSWPGGKGTGKGAAAAWRICLKAYGLTEAEALAYPRNPLDHLTPLAKAGVPIIHVVGDTDEIVPVAENTAIAQARYQKLGGVFKVIHKPDVGHHPHSLKDPQPIVDFVLKHTAETAEMTAEMIVSDRNFILRGSYQNSRIQFERNQRGHVAFIGGSITEMDGYRPKVCALLETRFPKTAFTFTQAGISSTCSDTGAFRFTQDVLSQGPLDLLFAEFAVNDDQDAARNYSDALRGMEGIIAQARRHNPEVDIVMTFFVNQNILGKLQQGETTPSIAAHSKVAAHYGVSVNHLAQELADLIDAGKMDWKQFGGVHPNDFGNTMCATMIGNALLQVWSKPLAADAMPQAHAVVSLIDDKSYVRGRLLPFEAVNVDSHWQVGVPDWKQESKAMVRSGFLNLPFIYSNTAGAKLSIDFTGTAIGAYLLVGPDAAIIRCTVDGQQTKEIDTLFHYNFNYPMTVMFFNELAEGPHTLELEVLENRPGRSKPGGTALRAIGFVAN